MAKKNDMTGADAYRYCSQSSGLQHSSLRPKYFRTRSWPGTSRMLTVMLGPRDEFNSLNSRETLRAINDQNISLSLLRTVSVKFRH
jgi:hypothetical protein